MKKKTSIIIFLFILKAASIFAESNSGTLNLDNLLTRSQHSAFVSYYWYGSIKSPVHNQSDFEHEQLPFYNFSLAFKPSIVPVLFGMDFLSQNGVGFSADWLFGEWPRKNRFINLYFGAGAGIDLYRSQSFLSAGPRIVVGLQSNPLEFDYMLMNVPAGRLKGCIECTYMPSYNINTSNNIRNIDLINFKIKAGISFFYNGIFPPFLKKENDGRFYPCNFLHNGSVFKGTIYDYTFSITIVDFFSYGFIGYLEFKSIEESGAYYIAAYFYDNYIESKFYEIKQAYKGKPVILTSDPIRMNLEGYTKRIDRNTIAWKGGFFEGEWTK